MVAPAVSSAQSRAESARAAAFLDLDPPAANGLLDRLMDAEEKPFGPALCKLTPWRHHLLLGYGSLFVSTELAALACSPQQLIQALYLCSPQFRAGSRVSFLLFRLRWGRLAQRRCRELAHAFAVWLDAAFSFMPAMPVEKKDGSGRPVADVHWLAGWVRVGRSLLSLNETGTVHTPYVRLWQYLEMETEQDPARPRFDRALAKKRGEYLRKMQERAKEKAS